ADMVCVSVRDQDIFDGLWIEAELSHSVHDQFFGVVREDRVDQDNALARRQSPCRVNFASDKVKIVEHASGVGVPRLTGRSAGGVSYESGHVVTRVFRAALRQKAKAAQRAKELDSGRGLGRLDSNSDLGVKISSRRCLQGVRVGGCKCSND